MKMDNTTIALIVKIVILIALINIAIAVLEAVLPPVIGLAIGFVIYRFFKIRAEEKKAEKLQN